MTRKKTRQIMLGTLKIGGNAPVSIQSMVNIDTKNIVSVVAQIKSLEKIGCEIIRVSVKDIASAVAISDIKRLISIPIEADIHFDHRLAILSSQSGADGIRLNPGNIDKPSHVKMVIKECRKMHIPIRIGINSGSLPRHYVSYAKQHGQPEAMVKSALDYLAIFKRDGFHDIMISLKASDTMNTIDAYRKISKACNYPLHIGVTATGSGQEAVIKSAIGIGTLLSEGIGDTIRVSLTADPRDEITVAKQILQALNIRRFNHEIISCPTCGRCQVNLEKIVRDFKKKLLSRNSASSTKQSPVIALMGCEVNGPGEAREADIGIAFGKDSGILFEKGKIVKKVRARDAVSELIKAVHKLKC
jgi:(E)-4-hydroxy-3-methylbut-2-enyl-diphosphate synthase